MLADTIILDLNGSIFLAFSRFSFGKLWVALEGDISISWKGQCRSIRKEDQKMTVQSIIHLFKQKRSCEAEISIIRDCTDILNDPDQTKQSQKYAILKRRIALIEHWLKYLTPDERTVVEQHLIQNKPWSHIAAQIERERNNEFSCDERTLQRLQAKAIASIDSFMQEQFGDSLDYLLDDQDGE